MMRLTRTIHGRRLAVLTVATILGACVGSPPDSASPSASSGAAGSAGNGSGKQSGGAGQSNAGSAGQAGSVAGAAGQPIGGGAGQGGGIAGTAGGSMAGAGGKSGGPSAGAAGTTAGAAGVAGSAGSGGQSIVEPTTCEEAALLKSHIGCEFWPTPTGNAVWSIFDYAVLVTNPGKESANVTVDRAGMTVTTASIAPGESVKLYLPWVPALKGGDMNACSNSPAVGTLGAVDGAYHLVSTRPVTAAQFSALEPSGKGGPPGKSWSGCPGSSPCPSSGAPLGCFSFSSDSSLLLPTSALTSNYRVVSPSLLIGQDFIFQGSYVAVTGITDGTIVTVNLSATTTVASGAGLQETGPKGVVQFQVNRSDVLQLTGKSKADIGGSLISATAPVQVIAGIGCAATTGAPSSLPLCNHMEEVVLPSETLGDHYLVATPPRPDGTPGVQIVRFVGHVDGTKLTYKPSVPLGAPTTLDAGQMVNIDSSGAGFEVEGTAPFMLGMYLPDATPLAAGGSGGLAMSVAVPLAQYRTRYAFAAPDDYDVAYAIVTHPDGVTLKIDGAAVTSTATPIAPGFGVTRFKLGPGQVGAHTFDADKPIGVQVIGYGHSVSYFYPAGLNLTHIAPP